MGNFLILMLIFLHFAASRADFQATPLGHRDLVSDIMDVNSFLKLGQKYYFFEDQAKVNWFKAAHLCRLKGSQLASIESREEMEALDSYMKEKGYKSDQWFWTSGNDLAATKNFEWLGTGKPFLYRYWTSNQPDYPDREHCVHLWLRENAFKWNNWECNNSAHYICEIDSPSLALFAYW